MLHAPVRVRGLGHVDVDFFQHFQRRRDAVHQGAVMTFIDPQYADTVQLDDALAHLDACRERGEIPTGLLHVSQGPGDMHEIAGRVERVDQNHVKYFLDLNPGEKRFVRYSVTYKHRKVAPELNAEKKREPL